MRQLAIYQDERVVEVLDTNGFQRPVDIFPAAVPTLVEDLRNSQVDFFVAPPLSEPEQISPLSVFAHAFVMTLIAVWLLQAFGMLGFVAFAMAIAIEGLTVWAELVGKGWELTVQDLKRSFAQVRGGARQERVPVLIESDDAQRKRPAQDDGKDF